MRHYKTTYFGTIFSEKPYVKSKEIVMKKILAMCLIVGTSLTACNSNSAKDDAIAREAALKHVKDSLTLDSFRKAAAAEQMEQRKITEQETPQTNVATDSHTHEDGQEYKEGGDPPQPVATNQKKGWSDAAKGTAIGAGVGAGVGALIDKDKRLRGAAIGAAIGGGGGYAIGRKSDRKSGRVQKK